MHHLNKTRLIIDRSILLFLSASKCCLRQGRECLRGLEARQSIVAQARASISIIMAVVKLTIFADPLEFSNQEPQPDAFRTNRANYQIQSMPSNANINNSLNTTTTTTTRSQQQMPNKRLYLNLTDDLNLNANQMMQHGALERNSSRTTSNFCAQPAHIENNQNADFANSCEFHSEFNHLFINNRDRESALDSSESVCSTTFDTQTSEEGRKTRLRTSSTTRTRSSTAIGEDLTTKLHKLNTFQRTLRWKSQQIMDYFLLSATGSATISAYDAIHRLQVSGFR